MTSTTALVVGGTGTMGTRVVRALAARTGTVVRVLTRDPSSARARALVENTPGEVRPVRGDLDDEQSLKAAFQGVDQVFCNTDFFATASPQQEYAQGLRALRAAQQAGVDRFVWSSLDNAAVLTDGRIPVPHYDAKAAVEAHIALQRSEEAMRQETDGWYSRHVAVLVTAPYFENLYSFAPRRTRLPDGREGLVFALPLGEAGRWPLIALDDIAFFARHQLDHWDDWGSRTLRIAADALTGDQIAAAFERTTGVPSAYQAVDLDEFSRSLPGIGHDLAAMFAFFQDRDLLSRDRNLEALRALHPGLATFGDWLATTGWDGTAGG
ncbi:NmrA/HSCARG family protein [Streptomyces botrytidirepellens]|uniref:NmrA/HSCARG family protein n=1 Tax=Streptomyces botrytidirepellens TaxID=2486417 RepID=A0A3M8TF53_9ACTN|nr:NmrA/HSCARG family protein [Streptomyces botrytidirepellens]RNF90144.1 NmrA/HSCARG family protein [Streptomyces botrytidirepellens]